MKLQVEFISVLGMLILILVVIFYAYGSNLSYITVPEDVMKVQKSVEQMIEGIMRDSANHILFDMENHGGYISTREMPGYTRFAGMSVPYWQVCENDISPSLQKIKERFENALEMRVKERINDMDFSGKNVTFDLSRLNSRVNILNEKLVVELFLPTKVEGYDIKQPYTVEIPTKFGEIVNFAKDLSAELAKKRHFETFTIYSVYFSPDLEDGHPVLPTIGVITDRGVLYRSPEVLSEGLDNAIRYVIANTKWWSEMSVREDVPKTFSIPSVNGKKYMDLNIRLFLSDGFKAQIVNPVLFENTDMIVDWIFFVFPESLYFYHNAYEFHYPIVIRVDDPCTGYAFNFASFVYVTVDDDNTMAPGSCGVQTVSQEIVSSGCENLGCSAKIKVVEKSESSGEIKPLENAEVIYGGCFVGVTDSNGVVEGPVKCGVNELIIFYNTTHEIYKKTIESDRLSGTYILHKIPEIVMRFKKVIIEPEGCYGLWRMFPSSLYTKCVIEDVPSGDYAIIRFKAGGDEYPVVSLNENSISWNCINTTTSCQGCMEDGNITLCEKCMRICTIAPGDVLVDYIPAGSYTVTGSIRRSTNGLEMGAFSPYRFHLTEDVEEIYAYIPAVSHPSYEINSYYGRCLTDTMKNICGINPLDTFKHHKYVYVSDCSYESVSKIVEDLSWCKDLINKLDMWTLRNTETVKRLMLQYCDAELRCV